MTNFEDRIADWLSVEQAMKKILDRVTTLDVESVQINSVLGRTLARDLCARSRLPPFANSALGGYAVRG